MTVAGPVPSRPAETGRLALVIVALILAALAFTDQLTAHPPWWRWMAELAAAWAAIIVALSPSSAPVESMRRRIVRYVAAAIAVAAGALAFRWQPIAGHEFPTGVAIVAALVAGAVARWVPFHPDEVRILIGDPTPARVARTRRHPWTLVRVGLGVLTVAAAVGAVVVNRTDHLGGFVLWLASLAIFAATCWQPAATRTEKAPAPALPCDGGRNLSSRGQGLLLGLILLLAVGLRFPLLATVPWDINPDEGRQGRHAEAMWASGFPDAFDIGWNVFPQLSFMIEYAGVQALGTSAANLRLSAAVVGTLSLLPLFFWARRWWGSCTALLATCLMAINREHLNWSRIAFNNIHQVGVAALMLATFARALRTRRLLDWVWLGYATGLAFHTYHAAKLFPVLLAGAAALLALGISGFARRYAAGAVVAAAACVLCCGPLAVTMYEKWDIFYPSVSNRDDVASLVAAHAAGNVAAVRSHLAAHVLGTLFAFTTVPRLRDAIFDPFVAVPFWLGVGWMLWRWRDPRHLVVLTWGLGIVVIGGMMTDYPPAKARMLGLLPAVCVIPAVIAGRLRAQVTRVFPFRGDYLVVPVLLVWLGCGLEFVWRSEFVLRPAEQRGLDPMNELYRVIEKTALPATFYLARGAETPPFAEAIRDCMVAADPKRHLVELANDASIVPVPPHNTGTAVLVIMGFAEDLVPLVEHYYPDAKHEIVRDPNYDFVVLHAFTLTQADIARRQGLLGPAPAAGDRAAQRGTTRFAPPADAAMPFAGNWRGLIWIPEPGRYAFRAAPGRVRIGSTWSPEGAPATDLPAGWHEIEIEATLTRPTEETVLEWTPPGTAIWAKVPGEFLHAHPALHGLLGRYWGAEIPAAGPRLIDAVPDYQRIDPVVRFDWFPQTDEPPTAPFAARPSTMEWVGTVAFPEGDTMLRLAATAPTEVYIDDRLVASTPGGRDAAPAYARIVPKPNRANLVVRTRRGATDDHRFWKLELLWLQPGGTWSAFADYAPPDSTGLP